jgi:drug/metabolite transporter (DMT)-like permease
VSTSTHSATFRGAALVVVWSSGFLSAELGAAHADPGTLLAWRCLVTAVVLAPWLPAACRLLDRRDWVRQAVVGVLCQALYLAGVVQAAAAGVPAGTSALVTSLQPAVVLVGAALAAGRRLTTVQVGGLLLGTAGVALTAVADLRSGTALPTLALPFGAMLALTVGTLLQERWSRPSGSSVPLLPSLAVQSLVTAGFAVGFAVPAGALAPPPVPGFWVAVGWGVLAGVSSYALYYVVTARDGAGRVSTLLYLTPAVTTLWALPLSGRTPPVLALLGLGVSGAAVALLHRSHRCSERVPVAFNG